MKTTNEYRSSTPSLLVLILLRMSTVKKTWVMRKGHEGAVSQCQESFTRGGVIVERLWILQGSFRSLWQGLNEACHRVPGKKKKRPPDSEKPVYSQDAGRIPKSNVLDIQNTHSCSDSGESQVLGGGGATHACYTESDRPSWGSLRTESLGKSGPHSLSGRCCFRGSGHLRTSEHGPDLSPLRKCFSNPEVAPYRAQCPCRSRVPASEETPSAIPLAPLKNVPLSGHTSFLDQLVLCLAWVLIGLSG